MSYSLLPWSSNARSILFQVEPNTKLFPAVLVQPSNQNMVQLELGKLKVRNFLLLISFLPFSKTSFPLSFLSD